MSPLDLLRIALATWYISHAVTALSGPLRLFTRLRGVSPLSGLLSCIYCLSIWVALGLYIIMQHDSGHYLIDPFAVAGAALMLRSYSGAGVYGD
jgi:hypothetical protein